MEKFVVGFAVADKIAAVAIAVFVVAAAAAVVFAAVVAAALATFSPIVFWYHFHSSSSPVRIPRPSSPFAV